MTSANEPALHIPPGNNKTVCSALRGCLEKLPINVAHNGMAPLGLLTAANEWSVPAAAGESCRGRQ